MSSLMVPDSSNLAFDFFSFFFFGRAALITVPCTTGRPAMLLASRGLLRGALSCAHHPLGVRMMASKRAMREFGEFGSVRGRWELGDYPPGELQIIGQEHDRDKRKKKKKEKKRKEKGRERKK
jgi:hypothetical protein